MAKAKGGQNTVQQVEALVRPVIEGMGRKGRAGLVPAGADRSRR